MKYSSKAVNLEKKNHNLISTWSFWTNQQVLSISNVSPKQSLSSQMKWTEANLIAFNAPPKNGWFMEHFIDPEFSDLAEYLKS